MAREHLTLLDLTDREFLLVLEDAGDADGWADSLELATRLDMESRHAVSSRLSWMARTEPPLVEREAERDEHGAIRATRHGEIRHTQRWRMTELGRAFAHGQLRARQREMLDRLDDAAMLEVTRLVTRRAHGTVGWVMNREWRYGLAHRNGS